MDYQFTVLTVSQRITTASSGNAEQAPWSNLLGKTIAMPGLSLSKITIRDDDDRFDSGRYSPGETGQALTVPFTFGNDPLPTPAGTQLAYHVGTVIQSQTPNADGRHDQFLAIFPRKLVSGAFGAELGGRQSVLLLAMPRADGTVPVFSPTTSYKALSVQPFGSSYASIAYPKVACFALGTLIETGTGPRPVELLRAGDLVLTRDHALQPVRWQGGCHVTREGLDLRPNLRPIAIRRGALGDGCPSRDLTVSPQHRVLVRSRIAHRLFDTGEILVAAKHLAGLPGIEVAVPQAGVTYFHLLFDRHEIVLSDGAWTESLFTGPEALKAVSEAARHEIRSLFPDLLGGDAIRPARRLLSGREARQLADRQRRNLGKRRLVEPL